jgi:hypothetical protein
VRINVTKELQYAKGGGKATYHAETERKEEDADKREELHVFTKLCGGAGFHHRASVEELRLSAWRSSGGYRRTTLCSGCALGQATHAVSHDGDAV